jgi:catechol 2,3-dioxygenase-like lactoylglutathione lyase family enzyme
MISGLHALIYSADAAADRAFLRDVLGLPHVDGRDGWLIFKAPPTELAVHPTDGPPAHELYLMADDIGATLADLRGKGVEVVDEPADQGWGLLAAIRMPSGGTLHLYQPRHPTAHDL